LSRPRCAFEATGGFNASQQAIGTASTQTVSIEGIETFNGDGTGTFTEQGMFLSLPPTLGYLPGANSNQASGSFTYNVAGHRFTSQNVPGTFAGLGLTGSLAGITFTVDIPEFTGFIELGERTLTASILTPGVETITRSDGFIGKRICHRSRVYTKL
jgi:hypothetical protein